MDYNFVYGETIYPEKTLIQIPDAQYEEINRKDLYRIHTVGFVFRIIEQTGMGIMVNFWERDSNIPWVRRNRMFISAYLTYEF